MDWAREGFSATINTVLIAAAFTYLSQTSTEPDKEIAKVYILF